MTGKNIKNTCKKKASSKFAHPEFTRYPHLKWKKYNVADYIHSPSNIVYSSWAKKFAWLPVTTLDKRRVWLKTVYRRDRKLLADIPQFPVNALDQVQWATLDYILERKLKGLD